MALMISPKKTTAPTLAKIGITHSRDMVCVSPLSDENRARESPNRPTAKNPTTRKPLTTRSSTRLSTSAVMNKMAKPHMKAARTMSSEISSWATLEPRHHTMIRNIAVPTIATVATTSPEIRVSTGIKPSPVFILTMINRAGTADARPIRPLIRGVT